MTYQLFCYFSHKRKIIKNFNKFEGGTNFFHGLLLQTKTNLKKAIKLKLSSASAQTIIGNWTLNHFTVNAINLIFMMLFAFCLVFI